jgi:hypothetical protein
MEFVALRIRDRLGRHFDEIPPIRLESNALERAGRRYDAVRRAVIAHFASPDAMSPAAMALTARLTADHGYRPGDVVTVAAARDFEERTPQLISEAEKLTPAGAKPFERPDLMSALDLDPAVVARQVAFELDTHLDLDLIGPDGTRTRYRFDPDGWGVELVGAHGEYLPETADQIVHRLDPALLGRADAAGVDAADRELIYQDLLTRTPVQSEAHRALLPELRQRMRQARAETDRRAVEWLTESLSGSAVAAGPPADTVPVRAARARRLLAAGLPPGWSTIGPLPLPLPLPPPIPSSLRPGTGIWIALPERTVAARLRADGTYRFWDPIAAADEQVLSAADFGNRTAEAVAVTLVEPAALRVLLEYDGDWAAARRFAEQHLDELRQDGNATLGTPVPPGFDASVPHRHRVVVAAIRAGQLEAAYDYLAADPATRPDVLAGAVAEATGPAGLRALAAVVDLDPGEAPGRPAAGAGVLRAVADILDPAVSALARFRAVGSAGWHGGVQQRWTVALQNLAERLPAPEAAEVALLHLALDINHQLTNRGIEHLLAGLPPADLSRLETRIAEAGLTAAELAQSWRSATSSGELFTTLPAASSARPVRPLPGEVVATEPESPAPASAVLVEWLGLTDWAQSRAFLDAHQRELLSDRALMQLPSAVRRPPFGTRQAAHAGVLGLARYGRLDEAYRYLARAAPPVVAGASSAPVTAGGEPTGRLRPLTGLLAEPDLAEPEAVRALADLAHGADATDAVDAADATILRLAADILAGPAVADRDLTAVVRTARGSHSADQRQELADAIRTLATNTSSAGRVALAALADRLYTPPPPTEPEPAGETPREAAQRLLAEATADEQEAWKFLAEARRRQAAAETTRDDALRRLADAERGLAAAEDRAAEAAAARRRRADDVELAGEQASAARDRLSTAWGRLSQAAGPDGPARAAAQQEVDVAEAELAVLGQALDWARDKLAEADAAVAEIQLALPGLRRQEQDAREDARAGDLSVRARADAVAAREKVWTELGAVRRSAEADLDELRLPDPPDPLRSAGIDLDAALHEIARSGYGVPAVVTELGRQLQREFAGGPPPLVVLTTRALRPAPDSVTAARDEVPVLLLDRIRLARDLARGLDAVVELRVEPAATAPYLAYPSGDVVKRSDHGVDVAGYRTTDHGLPSGPRARDTGKAPAEIRPTAVARPEQVTAAESAVAESSGGRPSRTGLFGRADSAALRAFAAGLTTVSEMPTLFLVGDSGNDPVSADRVVQRAKELLDRGLRDALREVPDVPVLFLRASRRDRHPGDPDLVDLSHKLVLFAQAGVRPVVVTPGEIHPATAAVLDEFGVVAWYQTWLKPTDSSVATGGLRSAHLSLNFQVRMPRRLAGEAWEKKVYTAISAAVFRSAAAATAQPVEPAPEPVLEVLLAPNRQRRRELMDRSPATFEADDFLERVTRMGRQASRVPDVRLLRVDVQLRRMQLAGVMDEVVDAAPAAKPGVMVAAATALAARGAGTAVLVELAEAETADVADADAPQARSRDFTRSVLTVLDLLNAGQTADLEAFIKENRKRLDVTTKAAWSDAIVGSMAGLGDKEKQQREKLAAAVMEC